MQPIARQVVLFRCGALYRVLWVDPTDVQIIDLNNPSAWNVSLSREEFAEQVLEAATDPFKISPNYKFTDERRLHRDEIWRLIEPLVGQTPEIFDPTWRHHEVCLRVKALETSIPRVHRALKRYWSRGMTPDACLPDFDKRGAPGVIRIPCGPRGRPPKLNPVSAPVTPELRSIFADVRREFYDTNPQAKLCDAHTEVVDRYFSLKTIDELGRINSAAIRPQPSRYQFYHEIKREASEVASQRRRMGHAQYEKDHRSVEGTSRPFGPNIRFEIDATVANHRLRGKYSREGIGRPVVYFVVDAFDSYIMAFALGIEAPSWVGAMHAIANTVMDKVDLCARYGVAIRFDEWLGGTLPEGFLADGAELATNGGEILMSRYQTAIEIAAPGRGDLKGTVEKTNDLVPAKFEPWVTGYIDPERHGPVPKHERDLEFDMDGFAKPLIESILYHNNHHLLEAKKRPAEMIADGVPPIPRLMREWGMAHRTGQPRLFDYDDVRINLLPRVEGTVTEHGFRVFDTFYTCDLARTRQLFRRARSRGVGKETFSWDPSLIDEVYWHAPNAGRDLIPCTLTAAHADRAGLTHQERMLILKIEKDSIAAHRPAQLDGHLTLVARLKENREEQIAQAKDLPDMSVRDRDKNLKANREVAANFEARRTRAPPKEGQPTGTQAPSVTPPLSVRPPIGALLKKL